MIDFDKRYLSKKTNVDLCFKIVDMSFEKASVLVYLKPKKMIFFLKIFQQGVNLSYCDLQIVKRFLILMHMKYLNYINIFSTSSGTCYIEISSRLYFNVFTVK